MIVKYAISNRELDLSKKSNNLLPDKQQDAQPVKQPSGGGIVGSIENAVTSFLGGAAGGTLLRSTLGTILGSTAFWGGAGGVAIIEIGNLLEKMGYIGKFRAGRGVGPYDSPEEQRKAAEEVSPGIYGQSWARRKQLREIENWQRKQKGEQPLPELPARHSRKLDHPRNQDPKTGATDLMQQMFGGGGQRPMNNSASPASGGKPLGVMMPGLAMVQKIFGSTSAPGGGSFATRPVGGGTQLTSTSLGLGFDLFGPPGMPQGETISPHDLIAMMRAILPFAGGGRGIGDAVAAGQNMFGGNERSLGGPRGGGGGGGGDGSKPAATPEDIQRQTDFRAFMGPAAMGPAQKFGPEKSFGPSTIGFATPLGKPSMLGKGVGLGLIQPNVQTGGDGGVGTGGKTVGWWTPERQAQAINKLMQGAHLPEVSARALVSRWMNVEAAQGPGEVNKIGATGIAQWLGQRKVGVKVGDFEGQLQHAVDELNGSEKAAGDALRKAATPEEAATGASRYERAEGYNLKTGRDNFTNKTIQGMTSVVTLQPGSSTAATKVTLELPPGVMGPGFRGELSGGKVDLKKDGTPPETPGGLAVTTGKLNVSEAERVADRDLLGGRGYDKKRDYGLSHIDPRLREIMGASIKQFEARNPGYKVQLNSAYRPNQGPHGSPRGALDVQIIGPDGRLIPNEGVDSSGKYGEIARLAKGYQTARFPELDKALNWGGHFETSKGSGVADLMHFDLEGDQHSYRTGIPHETPLPGVDYTQPAGGGQQDGVKVEAPKSAARTFTNIPDIPAQYAGQAASALEAAGVDASVVSKVKAGQKLTNEDVAKLSSEQLATVNQQLGPLGVKPITETTPPPATEQGGTRVEPGQRQGISLPPTGPSGGDAKSGVESSDAIIEQVAQQYGLDANAMKAIAQRENSGKATGQTGSYKGLFQLSEEEFRKYKPNGNIFNAQDNAEAFAMRMKDETQKFQSGFTREDGTKVERIGRPPTVHEMYMIHQRGIEGALEQIKNPGQLAWQAMANTPEGKQKGEAWAKKTVTGNLPKGVLDQYGGIDKMTAAQFSEYWKGSLKKAGVDKPDVFAEKEFQEKGFSGPGTPGAPPATSRIPRTLAGHGYDGPISATAHPATAVPMGSDWKRQAQEAIATPAQIPSYPDYRSEKETAQPTFATRPVKRAVPSHPDYQSAKEQKPSKPESHPDYRSSKEQKPQPTRHLDPKNRTSPPKDTGNKVTPSPQHLDPTNGKPVEQNEPTPGHAGNGWQGGKDRGSSICAV